MKLYADTFQVTETCNNGKERTFKKTVYSKIWYKDEQGRTLHNGEDRRLRLAEDRLRDARYYRVSHISSSTVDLMFSE